MTKPYAPVPSFYHERFTIAIMCNESLPLHWEDESNGMSYYTTVFAIELAMDEGKDYLLARTAEGETARVRMDLIRNMPAPVK